MPCWCRPDTPGVYLYSGTVTKPEDMNSTAPSTDTNQPLASKVPVANSQPPYYYQFTFLSPGTYTVAFTCQAALDNPDQADSAVNSSQSKRASPSLRARLRRLIFREKNTAALLLLSNMLIGCGLPPWQPLPPASRSVCLTPHSIFPCRASAAASQSDTRMQVPGRAARNVSACKQLDPSGLMGAPRASGRTTSCTAPNRVPYRIARRDS